MKNRNRLKAMLLGLLIMAIGATSHSQIYITGPTCVIPGAQYQYDITGIDTTTIQVCLTGGTLWGTGNTCYNGQHVSYIWVAWADTASAGAISLTASQGNAALAINVTRPFSAGQVDSAALYQAVSSGTIPSPINCPAALGGGCPAVYTYQWQQSPDGMAWADIAGATAQNLQFSAVATQNMCYRRKVSVAGTAGISNTAMVLVIPAAAQ